MTKAELFQKNQEEFVAGVEKLCADSAAAKHEDELCEVCLQWTCDGPQCHRDGICEDEK